MNPDRIVKLSLTLLLFLIFAYLSTNARFYNEALISAFFGLTLASVLIIQFRVRPSLADGVVVLAGIALLASINFRILHRKPEIMAWASFAGLSSLLVLGARTIWAKISDRRRLLLAFVPAVSFVVSEYFADTFLRWSAALHKGVLDLYLYSFDASLHVQLPFLLGKAFVRFPALRTAGIIFYIGLALPIALVYAGRMLRIGDKAIPSFVALLATGPIGVVFYNLLPALGPAHLFAGEFPWRPLSIAQAARLFLEPVALAGPPNAIPSLHMAWVLLVWWYSRGLSWWERSIAFLFLFFTVLATMGTGEHYFVDLIVAFPFAVLIEALFAFSVPLKNPVRAMPLVFGLLATLAWLLGLRFFPHFFWVSAVIPWALCVATVGLSLVVESRLQTPFPISAEPV
jgi:hypothetical protein